MYFHSLLSLLIFKQGVIAGVPGFLKLLLRHVIMCVCSPPRLLLISDVIWTPYDWLHKGYSFYMAATVIIGSGRGLRIEACKNQHTA